VTYTEWETKAEEGRQRLRRVVIEDRHRKTLEHAATPSGTRRTSTRMRTTSGRSG
jgi:hypothetical protein